MEAMHERPQMEATNAKKENKPECQYQNKNFNQTGTDRDQNSMIN